MVSVGAGRWVSASPRVAIAPHPRLHRDGRSFGSAIGPARRVEEIVNVAAAVGEPAVIGRAFCGLGRRTMVPTYMGRVPAIGIADREIPVITITIASTQDRRIALITAS
jgi:hypothetical protein